MLLDGEIHAGNTPRFDEIYIDIHDIHEGSTAEPMIDDGESVVTLTDGILGAAEDGHGVPGVIGPALGPNDAIHGSVVDQIIVTHVATGREQGFGAENSSRHLILDFVQIH